MLTTAFGAEKARALMRKASPETSRPFKFLKDYERQGALPHPERRVSPGLSVILPYLEPKKASGIIERMPEEERVEMVKRVARLEKVNPEVLRQRRGGHQGEDPQDRHGEPRGDRRQGGPRGHTQARRSTDGGERVLDALGPRRIPSCPRTCAIGSSPSRTCCACRTRPCKRPCAIFRTGTSPSCSRAGTRPSRRNC
jgi:hypothetical protein